MAPGTLGGMVRRALVLSLVTATTLVPGVAHGAAWVTPPATVSAATATTIEQPRVASNARGDSAVVWIDPATGRPFESERPVGGSFSVGAQVSAATDLVLGSVHIDDAGTIYVFYISDKMTPAASVPVVATKAIGAVGWTLTPLTTVSATLPAQVMIEGAIAPDGSGLVVWFQADTNGAQNSKLEFARKAAGSSTWSAKANIAASGVAVGNTYGHALAMNPAGQAALVWGRAGSVHLFGATMTAAGVWSTASAITSGGADQTNFP